MWNPFSKKKRVDESVGASAAADGGVLQEEKATMSLSDAKAQAEMMREAMGKKFTKEEIEELLARAPKMNAIQRMALKRILKMDPEKRAKILEKAITPEKMAENLGSMEEEIEEMRAKGQLNSKEYKIAKKRLEKMKKRKK